MPFFKGGPVLAPMSPAYNVGAPKDFVFGGLPTEISSFPVDCGCSPIPKLVEGNGDAGSQVVDIPMNPTDPGPVAVIGGCNAESSCVPSTVDSVPFSSYEDVSDLIPTLDELLGGLSVSKCVTTSIFFSCNLIPYEVTSL